MTAEQEQHWRSEAIKLAITMCIQEGLKATPINVLPFAEKIFEFIKSGKI